MSRMPTAFVSHGGGPWPLLDVGLPRVGRERESLLEYLQQVPLLAKTKPTALLIISAHWEASVPTVMSAAKPPMLFDYGGFPPESYALDWPAPGDPVLARRVRSLLEAKGFQTAEDPLRGFDHGTFVPMIAAFPKAEIPVVQLSLIAGLDPAKHLEMGRALAPLRDEGVFIIGSGNTFHNFRAMRSPSAGFVQGAEVFDEWLRANVNAEASIRDEALTRWQGAPFGRQAHPREEHLIPLMVVAGAAGTDRGQTTWQGSMMGLKGSGFHFG